MKQKSIKVNAILNVIKQGLGIIFPLITYPYVSRVLGAGNLGRFSFSESIVQIFITLSLIGIPTYAVREGAMVRNEKKKIDEFCAEVFTINFISALLSYIILFLLVLFVDRIRVETVFILILSVNIMSKWVGRDWLNSIYEDYLYISIRFIIVRIFSLILIFLLVKTPDDLTKYVIIMGFSELAGNLLNIYYTGKVVPYQFVFSKNLRRHLKPLLVLFCISVASTIYIRSDITILGFLRPDSDVGIYTLSSRIYTIVKNILNAIIMVTIPRLSFYLGKDTPESREKYNRLLNKLRNALVLLLFPATTGLFFLSGDVMYILGGAEFQSGGNSLGILCIAMAFAVFGCFYANAVLIVNRKETIFFKATVISAFVNIILNFIFIPFLGINGAAVTTVFSELCIVLICGFSAVPFFRNDRLKLKQYLIPTVLECIAITVVALLMNRYVHSLIPRIVLTISLSCVIYFIILLILRNELLFDSINKIKNRYIRNA